MDFEVFRPDLNRAQAYSDGSKGGRPPFDPALMFKILVIQTLNNLSDERTEYLINDRLSLLIKSHRRDCSSEPSASRELHEDRAGQHHLRCSAASSFWNGSALQRSNPADDSSQSAQNSEIISQAHPSTVLRSFQVDL